MQRLLVKVLKKTQETRYRDRNGLDYAKYRLRVKVEGSAIGALSVPKGVIGKETTIGREAMLPWGIKTRDLIVLDPGESARVLRPRKPVVDLGCAGPGRIELRSGDPDRDGYPEDVLANQFLAAVVQPHRGARLLSLKDCSGRDRFASPFEYIMAGKYILLGGAEPVLYESGSPGEIWKSEFERGEPVVSDTAVEIDYSRKLKEPEGVALRKHVRVSSDFPGTTELYTVSYAGKKKPAEREDGAGNGEDGDGKKKKDETDVSFGIRMSTRSEGDPVSLNVFELPAGGDLVRVRYHRPPYGRRWRWRDWRDEHFGLKPGFLVARNEGDGRAMAVLFAPGSGCLAAVRSDYPGPEVTIRHAPRKVKKGGRTRFGLAFLIGNDAASTGTSMFMGSVGRGGRGGIPVALTLRTARRVDAPRASVRTATGRRSVTLAAVDVPGAGRIHTKTITLPRAAFPLDCTVRAGGERLSVRLEA
jgi:hypothetical protein